jgi:hypothetical protein
MKSKFKPSEQQYLQKLEKYDEKSEIEHYKIKVCKIFTQSRIIFQNYNLISMNWNQKDFL